MPHAASYLLLYYHGLQIIRQAPAQSNSLATAVTESAFVRVSHLLHSSMGSDVALTLVSAIANYTTRVATTSLSATQRQEALKFIG